MPAASDIRAGAAYVELFLKDGKLRKGLLAASKRLKAFGASLRAMGTKMISASAAILTPLVAATKVFAKMGADLDDMSQRTGTSVEALSELGYAAGQSGTDVETLERSITKLQKSLGEAQLGSDTAASAFTDLGLSVAELKDLSPDEQFSRIADKLSRIADPARRAALAMGIFGKSGTKLLPMMADGAAGLEKLRQEARDFGLSVSTEDAQAAARLDDSLDLLWKTVKSGVFHIGAALAPALTELTGIASRVIATTVGWIKENRGLIVSLAAIAAAVGGIGVALVATGTLFSALGAAAAGLASVIGAAGTAIGLVASPLGLVVTLLGAAVVVWAKFTQSGQATLGVLRSIGATFKQTFGGILTALQGGDLAMAGRIALAGLRLAFLEGFAALSSAIGGQFGNLLGSLGQDIANGDFKEAWDTTVQGLAAVWDGFAEGIVAVFTTAMRLILDQWEKMTRKISGWILESSAKGGILGRLGLAGTGVSIQDEQQRAEAMRQKQIALKTRALEQARRDLERAAGGSMTDELGQTFTPEEIQRQIAELENQLADLQVPADVLADATRAAGQQLTTTADMVRGKLDALDRDAQRRTDDSADAFGDKIKNGAQEAADAVAAAQAELNRLLAEAQAARDWRTSELQEQSDDVSSPDELAAQQGKVAGTFNTVAASLLGGTNSPAERTARHTEAIAKSSKQTADNTKKLGLRAGNG